MEGVVVVELCCPSASSLSEDALMAAEEQRTPADVRRGGTFDSTDSSRSAVLAVPSTPAERVRWPKPVPSVVGMYPPSFQRGSYVPRDIQKFCFPDDDVIVPKMLQTPLACISQAATGCVPRAVSAARRLAAAAADVRVDCVLRPRERARGASGVGVRATGA
jgi:hypothetical protein